MFYQHRRQFAFALAVCLLIGLLPGTSRAEQMQTEPVADTPAAENVETDVAAVEMPTDTFEAIEAEQVSLSESEIRVNKGETKSLIPDAALSTGSQTATGILAATDVVWTSSNPAVATVDSSGNVTGIELGEATITATRNGTVVETFTVSVTLANGYYVFETVSSYHYICPDKFSLGNMVGMYALPTETYSSEELDYYGEIGRKWYLECLDDQNNVYYIIRPAYSSDMVLALFNGSDPVITQEGNLPTYAYHWEITSGTYYYVLENRLYADKSIAFEEADSTGAALVSVTHDTSDSAQNWCILSAFTPYGMLLFETAGGNLVDDSATVQANLHTAYLEVNSPKTLSQIGLQLMIINPGSASTSYSISFDSSAVSYNASNLRITAASTVTTTATITSTINGTQHSVAFTLIVYEKSGTISVYYDKAYNSRHSLAANRINTITQELTQKFATDFDILLTPAAPTLFTSRADGCPDNYNSACSCVSNEICNNASANITQDYAYGYHHKNAHNILDAVSSSPLTRRLSFIGHYVCYKTTVVAGSGHIVSGDNGYLYGLANYKKQRAQVHDHVSLAHEIATTVHEVGHLFGAVDHYSHATNGWTLGQLDDYDKDDTKNLFSITCLYGDVAFGNNSTDVINNLTVCEGCTKVIRGEILLPDKPPDNNENEGE